MRPNSRDFTLFAMLLALALASPSLAGWDEGVAAFKVRDFKTAAAQFRAAIQAAPSDYRGHYMLGLSLGARGIKPDALSHLRKAADLKPGDASVSAAIRKISTLSGPDLEKVSAELGAGVIAGDRERGRGRVR